VWFSICGQSFWEYLWKTTWYSIVTTVGARGKIQRMAGESSDDMHSMLPLTVRRGTNRSAYPGQLKNEHYAIISLWSLYMEMNIAKMAKDQTKDMLFWWNQGTCIILGQICRKWKLLYTEIKHIWLLCDYFVKNYEDFLFLTVFIYMNIKLSQIVLQRVIKHCNHLEPSSKL
jgi:hypothetical protein